jgi:hypothetical protein
MKKCTYCGKDYPDEAETCLLDQAPLVSCYRGPSQAPAAAGDLLPRQVLAPTAVWVLSAFLLFYFLGPAGVLVLNLATAGWAAMDCAKLRTKGSRQLGIAFKPVVVFAVCAFFLFGFGFIWYLIMRYRVRSAGLLAPNEQGHGPVAEQRIVPVTGSADLPIPNPDAVDGLRVTAHPGPSKGVSMTKAALAVLAMVVVLAVVAVLVMRMVASRAAPPPLTLAVWKTHSELQRGIIADINQSTAKGCIVLVVSHFRDTHQEFAQLFQTNGNKFSTAESAEQVREILTGKAFVPGVMLLTSSTIEAVGLFKPVAFPASNEVRIIVTEAYPIRQADALVEDFAKALPCKWTLRYCTSVDSPFMMAFGVHQNQSLVDGFRPEESLSHPFLLDSVRGAQSRIEQHMKGTEVKTLSSRDWFRRNL